MPTIRERVRFFPQTIEADPDPEVIVTHLRASCYVEVPGLKVRL